MSTYREELLERCNRRFFKGIELLCSLRFSWAKKDVRKRRKDDDKDELSSSSIKLRVQRKWCNLRSKKSKKKKRWTGYDDEINLGVGTHLRNRTRTSREEKERGWIQKGEKSVHMPWKRFIKGIELVYCVNLFWVKKSVRKRRKEDDEKELSLRSIKYSVKGAIWDMEVAWSGKYSSVWEVWNRKQEGGEILCSEVKNASGCWGGESMKRNDSGCAQNFEEYRSLAWNRVVLWKSLIP